MVQLELAKWLTREAGEDKADQVIAFTETCVVADPTTAIALSAAELGARHELSTANAIIYATARAYGTDLVTCGRHLEGLTRGVLRLKDNRITRPARKARRSRRRRPFRSVSEALGSLWMRANGAKDPSATY